MKKMGLTVITDHQLSAPGNYRLGFQAISHRWPSGSWK